MALNFGTRRAVGLVMAEVNAQGNYDVAIVGGGVAGLSAALILGRCLRRVLVFDSGAPRNFASRGLHGFLSRDGIHPLRLREIGREELARYETVEVRDTAVVAAHREKHGFELRPREGDAVHAKMLLLATGRVDLVPEKPGFRELYGRGVYHCAVCDGWEHRNQPLAVVGQGESAFESALAMLDWTRDLTLCTDGPAQLQPTQRARLARNGIALNEARVAAALGDDEGVRGIEFVDAPPLACRAIFFDAECPQKSPLAENLGCTLDPSGAVRCTGPAANGVPGLYVAGNVRCGLHLAITAAAEGVEAALAINAALRAGALR